MNLKFSRSTKPPKILEFSKLPLFSPPQDCWIFVSGRGTLSDCQPHSRDPAIYALVAITGATLIMLFFYLFGSGKLLIPLHDILKLWKPAPNNPSLFQEKPQFPQNISKNKNQIKFPQQLSIEEVAQWSPDFGGGKRLESPTQLTINNSNYRTRGRPTVPRTCLHAIKPSEGKKPDWLFVRTST